MIPKDLTPNWFDFLVLVAIVVGIIRGRKRGMSEEFLDVIQWLLIVFAGAFGYRPLGIFIANYTHMEAWVAFMVAYFAIAFVLILIFAGLKRAIGEKLVQSDTFGSFEYYLGMLAGAVRFLCMVVVLLAFVSGIYVTEADRIKDTKWQQESFGFRLIPTPGFMQQIIFHESACGQLMQKHAANILIQPVPPGAKGDTIAKKRERAVDEIMDPKK
jgi:uncharacterized membrane protein required for colicin V production